MGEELEIGKRYELTWPKGRPAMQLVGTVVAISRNTNLPEAAVRYADDREPHRVFYRNARIRPARADQPDGFKVRVQACMAER